jgi:hypothetical protein
VVQYLAQDGLLITSGYKVHVLSTNATTPRGVAEVNSEPRWKKGRTDLQLGYSTM